MRFLLDTHVWLWLNTEPERIAPSVRALLAQTRNELVLSAASAWEIAIKYALGKLPLPEPPAIYVPQRLQTQGIASLPVDQRHALHVATLPRHHDDPFDRLLIAQTILEGVELVTADRRLEPYGVPIIWTDRALRRRRR